jgi:hypothetical protein
MINVMLIVFVDYCITRIEPFWLCLSQANRTNLNLVCNHSAHLKVFWGTSSKSSLGCCSVEVQRNCLKFENEMIFRNASIGMYDRG